MKPQNLDLVVVTGAGGGIGRATATAFAAEGATVIVADISEPSAKETAAQIVSGGGKAFAYRLDVSDADMFAEFAQQVRDRHGVADVIVNNAGIGTVGTALDVEAADWDRVIGVNLMGVIHGSRLFGRQMLDRGQGGHIVNIASLASFMPNPGAAPYTVSKAAVRMLSECFRVELSAHNIGVSAICPGAIHTAIYADSKHTGVDAETAKHRAETTKLVIDRAGALGLISPPEHVAKIVVRSVRHNWAIVPVRPEAWISYFISRLSPGLLRVISRRIGSADAFVLLERLMDTSIGQRFLGAAR